MFEHIVNFVRLGRPLNLAGGFVFNGLGLSAALYTGAAIDWTAAGWCQLAITATQVMTHYGNEYFDQDADAAALTPTRWASGSRILPLGLLPPAVALVTALVSGGIALTAAAVLIAATGSSLLTLFLLLLAMLLAWNYSGPPLSLNRRGLGEITAAVLVPGLTTMLSYEVQTGRLALLPLAAVVPLCFFQFTMLLSVNFPDAAGDRLVDKRTLVVIHGPERMATLFLVALSLPFLALPLFVWLGLPPALAIAVWLTLPLAILQARRIRQGAATNPDRWQALAFWSIVLLMAAALLETAAFLFLSAAN